LRIGKEWAKAERMGKEIKNGKRNKEWGN